MSFETIREKNRKEDERILNWFLAIAALIIAIITWALWPSYDLYKSGSDVMMGENTYKFVVAKDKKHLKNLRVTLTMHSQSMTNGRKNGFTVTLKKGKTVLDTNTEIYSSHTTWGRIPGKDYVFFMSANDINPGDRLTLVVYTWSGDYINYCSLVTVQTNVRVD